MVLGICSVILFCGLGVISGIIGLITGIIAMREMKSMQYARHSRGMDVAGIVCSGLGILIFAYFVWFYA